MTDTSKVSEATEPPLTGTAHSDAKEAGIARRRRRIPLGGVILATAPVSTAGTTTIRLTGHTMSDTGRG